MMLVEYLEKSAKELINELNCYNSMDDNDEVHSWILDFLREKLVLRDAEILAMIEIEKNSKEADTLPPGKNNEEKTKVDNLK